MKCETPISGLYASGECSCLSLHGANRLGTNSTAECLVFGRVSGEEAAKYAPTHSFHELAEEPLLREEERVFDGIWGSEGDERVPAIRNEMRRIMNEKVWIFRTGEQLQSALKEIRALRARFENVTVEDKGRHYNTGLVGALQLDFTLDLADVTIASALARTESRGAHSRRDYPNRDDENWLKHTVAHYREAGPCLKYTPVTITKWPPTARKY